MKKKNIFKERKQSQICINSGDTRLKDSKTSDWTMPKHLSKKDHSDLKIVKRFYVKGKFQEALKYASNLDTIMREEIPSSIWKEIGGKLTRTGEERLRKAKNKTDHQNLLKFSNCPDDLNPNFLFHLTATQLLVEALKKEFDIEYYARKELANRGLGSNGEWVGFQKAKEIHRIE